MMNEKLREYLRSINVRVVNSVQKSIKDKEAVGWHCVATDLISMNGQIDRVIEFIIENDIGYSVSDDETGNSTSFFIYI